MADDENGLIIKEWDTSLKAEIMYNIWLIK